MKNNSFLIGNGNIIVFAVASLSFILFFICETLGFAGLIAAVFLTFAYRNDSRHIFTNDKNILSPVDGRVFAIDNSHGKKKIYCKVSLCGVHKVLSPIDGDLEVLDKQNGLNLNPNSFKASLLNEQVTFKVSNEVFDMELKLISGKYNFSLDHISKGKVKQGENIALLFDGVAVITLNESCDISLNIGDKLKAGQTKIS